MCLILAVFGFMVAIMKTTARAALCLVWFAMDAISNCAPAVALVTKMIKEAKRSATNYCLIHVRERTSLLCRLLRLFIFKISKIGLNNAPMILLSKQITTIINSYKQVSQCQHESKGETK